MTDTFFNFKSNGASQIVGDLQKIQAQFDKSSQGVLQLSKALGSSFSEAKKFSDSIGLSGDRAAKAVNTFRQLSDAGSTTQERFNALNKGLGITSQQFLALEKAIAASDAKLKQFNADKTASSLGGLNNQLKATSSQAQQTSGDFKELEKTLVAAGIAVGAVQFLKDVVTEAIKTRAEFQALEVSLNAVSGSSAAGAENLEFIRKTATDLSISIPAATKSFVQLAAAAKGTQLEGQGVKDIFSGISAQSRVLGLSTAQQDRAFLALSQSISKGRLTAEELNQQLNEALPGSTQKFAQALGVSTQELLKLISAGKVGLPELQKFGKFLQEDAASGIAAATQTTAASIEKLNNALFDFSNNLGKSLEPATQFVSGTLGGFIDGFNRLPEPVRNTTLALAGLTIAAIGLAAAINAGLIGAVLAGGAAFGAAALAAGPYILALGALVIACVAAAEGAKAAANAFTGFNEELDAANNKLAATDNRFTEAIDKLNKGIPLSVEELEKLKTALREQAKAEGGSADVAEQRIGVLERANAAVLKQVEAEKNRNAAIKAQADELKKLRDIEKTQQERKFQGEERTIARQLADEKAKREQKLQDDIARKQEANELKLAAIKKRVDDEAKARKEQGDKELQDKQKAFNEELDKFKKGREDKIQDRQKQFEKELTDFKLQEETKIADKKKRLEQEIADFKDAEENKIQQQEKRFEREQQAQDKQFSREQQAEEKRFSREQQEEEKQFRDQFEPKKDAARQQIDRTLELEAAKDPEEKSRLKKQFEEEDRQAKRRLELERQILKPIEAQEEAFKQQQQAAQDAFKARQDAEKDTFKTSQDGQKDTFQSTVIDPQKKKLDQTVDQKKEGVDSVISKDQQALQDALDAKKLAFERGELRTLKNDLETELEARKTAFEQGPLAEIKKKIEADLDAIRIAGESKQKEAKKQSETEIKALRDKFAADEKARDRKTEDDRIAREQKFKDDQRLKDEDSAKRVKEILQSIKIQGLDGTTAPDATSPAGIAGLIPRLFTGGSVLPNQPVIVGDGPGGTIGPHTELFVPKVAGRILNANQTRDILATLPQFTRPSVTVAPSQAAQFRPSSLASVVQAVERLQRIVEKRPVVPTKVEVNHLGDPRNPRTITYDTMRDLLRMRSLG